MKIVTFGRILLNLYIHCFSQFSGFLHHFVLAKLAFSIQELLCYPMCMVYVWFTSTIFLGTLHKTITTRMRKIASIGF